MIVQGGILIDIGGTVIEKENHNLCHEKRKYINIKQMGVILIPLHPPHLTHIYG